MEERNDLYSFLKTKKAPQAYLFIYIIIYIY